MENFILSVNVVLPIFLLISLGYLLKILKIYDKPFLDKLNTVIFKVFLPVLLFYNIYNTDINIAFNFKVLFCSVIFLLTMILLSSFIIPIIEKDNKKRGVMIQAFFRSNYVLFGVPIASSLAENGDIGMTTMIIAAIVPMYNAFAVIILEIFRGGKINMKKIIKGIITNPLIIGCLIGLICLLAGIEFSNPIEKTVKDISGIATPLALIVLGGSFQFKAINNSLKQLIISVAGRIFIVPLIYLPVSILLGFRGIEIISLIPMLVAPCAVSSYTMAEQMEADGELAGQIVVFSSIFSVFTITFFVFMLKQYSFI